jgi:hypothetical protein
MKNTTTITLKPSRILRGGRLAKTACGIVSFAPLVMSGGIIIGASSAQAADECGVLDASGPTILTCPAGSYPNGIKYSPDSDFTTTLILNDENIRMGSDSVLVDLRRTSQTSGDIIIIADSFDEMISEGDIGRGFWILNQGPAGDATITVGSNAGRVQTNGFQAYGALSDIGTGTGNATVAWWGGDFVSFGQESGLVYAFTRGSGATHAEMNGGTADVRGSGEGRIVRGNLDRDVFGSTGVYSFISNGSNSSSATASLNGGSLTILGKNSFGVRARTSGLGSAITTMSGGSIVMSGDGAQGLRSQITNTASTEASIVTMSSGTVLTGGDSSIGAFSSNAGIGNARVSVSGDSVITASGTNSIGVATSGMGYEVLVDDTASVAANLDSGAGIVTNSQLGSTGTITVRATARVSGAQSIIDGAGDAVVRIEDNATVTGDILLQGGSDRLTIANDANIEGVDILDGGIGELVPAMLQNDNNPETDLILTQPLPVDVDVLNFSDWVGTVDGARLVNWEEVFVINGADVTFTDSLEPGTGLANGDMVNGLLFQVDPGSFARFADSFDIAGDVNNFGTLDLSTKNGTPDTILTIAGNYSAASNLLLDVTLNEGGPNNTIADQVVINGNVAGVTTVIVNNTGGAGGATDLNNNGLVDPDEGIAIVRASGATPLDPDTAGVAFANHFVLGGDNTFVSPQTGRRNIAAGAYAYDIYVIGSEASGTNADSTDYVLASQGLQPAAPVYDALPSVLLDLTRVSTLAQRIEGRQMLAGSVDADHPVGAWLRIEGQDVDTTPKSSATGQRWSRKFGPFVKVDRMTRETIRNGKEKDAYA